MNFFTRTTSQKQLIADFLKNTNAHPTAEAIYQEIKKSLPRISLGTVYRILKQMKEQKLIKEIKGEVARYDGQMAPHFHFICQKCGKIIDIFQQAPAFTHLLKQYQDIGEITDMEINFYGKCRLCDKRSIKNKKNKSIWKI